MQVNALITAGGIGSRMGLNISKQFYKVNNLPIIAYTIQKFNSHPLIDSIYVVCLEEYIDYMTDIVSDNNFTKVKGIIPGGENNQQSIFNGLCAISGTDSDIILIHDGNRPLVPSEVITDCIDTVISKGNAVAQIPCTESLLIVDELGDGSSDSFPREKIKRTQTPHGFYLGEIKKVHEIANSLGIQNTIASCNLYQAISKKIYFSRGDSINFKLTTQDDLKLFEIISNGLQKKLNHE